MGARSFSPSPMTTRPAKSTRERCSRMARTAAASAASLSPLPSQRAAATAADSVTRTISSARLRVVRERGGPPARAGEEAFFVPRGGEIVSAARGAGVLMQSSDDAPASSSGALVWPFSPPVGTASDATTRRGAVRARRRAGGRTREARGGSARGEASSAGTREGGSPRGTRTAGAGAGARATRDAPRRGVGKKRRLGHDDASARGEARGRDATRRPEAATAAPSDAAATVAGLVTCISAR